MLGNIALSNARLVAGNISFGNNFDQLSMVCSIRGYSCRYRPGYGSETWEGSLSQLVAGHPVIALLDPYYLPHYWMGYERTHTLHAVVLWSLADNGRSIIFSDPFELLRHDGVLPLEVVERAWTREDVGQAFIDLVPTDSVIEPGSDLLLQELRQHLRNLVMNGEQLGCLSLAIFVREHLDKYFDLVLRISEPNVRLGRDDKRRECSHFLRGIINFHHTLRWFGIYANVTCHQVFGEESQKWIPDINEIAQTWLVLRNIFMKYGLSSGRRRIELARSCRSRLDRLIDELEQIALRLEQSEGEDLLADQGQV